MAEQLDTHHKALTLNLDAGIFGAILGGMNDYIHHELVQCFDHSSISRMR